MQNNLKALEYDIKCHFGRFGTTSGALISPVQIACPTPISNNTNFDVGNGEEVQVQLSLNGQDYLDVSHKFKFVSKSAVVSSSEGVGWIATFMLGIVIVVFSAHIINQISKSSFGKTKSLENTSLTAGIPKSDDPNAVPTETMPGSFDIIC